MVLVLFLTDWNVYQSKWDDLISRSGCAVVNALVMNERPWIWFPPGREDSIVIFLHSLGFRIFAPFIFKKFLLLLSVTSSSIIHINSTEHELFFSPHSICIRWWWCVHMPLEPVVLNEHFFFLRDKLRSAILSLINNDWQSRHRDLFNFA